MRTWMIIILMAFGFIGQAQLISKTTRVNPDVEVAAERLDEYLDLISNQKIAIVANQTSLVDQTHLVDTLFSLGLDIQHAFAPEHGFRGAAEAGATIKSGVDQKTGLKVISLYGSNKKPSADSMAGLDVVIFDIQDVGARFYTYISTLHYVMESAAENDVQVLVLDRPNPNGFYVDGPIREPAFESFIGKHQIPIVHGMTVGELALMINGEGWLGDGLRCDLEVIRCGNYSHLDLYDLPVKPSPNLPNASSIYLYPSLCLFEGTQVSVGRGTDSPFQIIGHPLHKEGSFEFTPRSIPGVSEKPKYLGEQCFGNNLKSFGEFYFTTGRQLYLEWLVAMYESYPDKSAFFRNNLFDKLAGTSLLREQIEDGIPLESIRKGWQAGLAQFKIKRKKYLLYEDFE
jgi:uncharacterized protein YbbC (DUF1343 family)